MTNVFLNHSQNNISKFKRYYILFIFICGSIQLILSEDFTDLTVLFYVILINILILFYCFQSNKFKLFPISYLIIFFSFFFNAASALFLKTLELNKVSSNLYLPKDIYFFLLISTILIITTHMIYIKNYTKNKKSFIFNLIQKFGLFNIHLNLLFYLGVFSLIIQILYTFDVIGSGYFNTNILGSHGVLKDFMRGYNPFYILIFQLILSKHLFNKYYSINKIVYFLLFLIVIYISITTNRRDILFFGILNLLMILMTIFLLGKIQIHKKQFFKYFSIFIILLLSYETILKLNYAYLIERNNVSKSSFTKLTSFLSTFSKLNNNENFYKNFKSNMQLTVTSEINIKSYYDSLIFERLNPIKFADSILFFAKRLDKNSLNEIKSHGFNRILSIIPEPFINIVNKNYNKSDYMDMTVASKIIINTRQNRVAFHDVGSFLIELKIFFGLLFFLPMVVVAYLIFIVFDSFYDKKKEIFSPIILIFLFYGSSSVYGIFSSTSLDSVVAFIIRGIPQSILLYLIFKMLFNFFFKTKTNFS